MPEVRVSRVLENTPLHELWRTAIALEHYPKFIDSVLSVEVLERRSDAAISSWAVLFNGNELRWTENDRFDRERRTITFEQIDGDLAEWSGTLTFVARGTDIVATYVISFDLGIPSLGHLLHPLGEAAILQSCEQMLQSLDAEVRSRYHA